MRIVTLSARRVGTTLAVGALALTSAACGSSSSSGASGTPATSAGAPATSAAAQASVSGKAAPSVAASAVPSVSGKAAPSAGTPSATAAAPTAAAPTSGAPTSAAAALPTSLTIASDAEYAPIESIAKDGKTIVGVDPDLGAALGKALGIKVTFVNATFDGIVAGVASGRYGAAMSAMTDNTDREKQVDFVDYYSAGTSFMIKKGGKTVNTLADVCGRKVAAEKGTTQVDDVTAQNKKCTTKATLLQFDNQGGANLALSSGRADVVMADSPVNAYAAKQSNGAFTIVGTIYGTAPYGIAVPKKSTALRDALVTALNKMIADGSYKAILTKWGVQAGAITTAKVNGAAG